jgi:hypothetical protein
VRLVRPRSVPAVSGQLGAGVRAGTTNVGYLGSAASLTVLNPGDALPAPLNGGAASWVGNELQISASNIVLNQFRINAGVYSSGTNLTFTNGRIVAPATGVLYALFTESGNLTVTDATIYAGGDAQLAAGIGSSSGKVTATRCDLSGAEDGIGLYSASKISQCYIHDLVHRLDAHVDGVQSYGDSGLIVEHCYIDIRGIHESGCATSNGPNAVINNNFMAGGTYFLRFETAPSPGASSGTVTNNDFGALLGDEAAEVHQEAGGMIATFTNNRHFDGSLITSPS